jgi:rod shape determining protein RodA
VGVLMVFSATNSTRTGAIGLDDNAVKQAMFGGIGILLMFALARVDFRFLESFTLPFYLVTVILLSLVTALGVISYGAQRWLDLGIIPIQPSELAKLSLIILLAKFLSDRAKELNKLKWFVVAGLIAGVPTALVLTQPDLGTAIILSMIFLGMTIGAHVSGRIFLFVGAVAVPAFYVFWTWLMHDYQRARFTIFLHPESDPSGAGYNIIQARITAGSGGLLGQGFLHGSQSQLEFIKVQYSDFIFSVVAEQFGFIGSVVMIGLLFILVWRCLVVASRAPDGFGSLICIGVAAWIGMQIFINVGMNIGLMPVTGIPLPFISYGGSSLLSILLALGLVQSVAVQSSSVVFGGSLVSPGWARSGRTTLRPH